MLKARRVSAAQDGMISSDPLTREIHEFRSDAGSLQFMTSGAAGLRPLIMLQALEYPGWPAVEFCARAEAAGFRTICLRRPGFGRVPPLPDLDAQVQLIGSFLEAHTDGEAVLACAGTSNMLGYRLAGHSALSLTVLANCCFNYNPISEIRPDWFARHIEQTLTSATGARLALMGLKGAQGIFGQYWVTENFMQKSQGDLDYLHANRELFSEAMECLIGGLDIHTFIMELRGTLGDDAFLQDGCFEGLPVVSVSGAENSEGWKTAIRAEAERVGAPLHFFPSGDALVLYQSAGELMDLIGQYS